MIKISNILPVELGDFLSSLDYEENGGIKITKVSAIDSDLQIELYIYGGISEPIKEYWLVNVKNIQAESINFKWAKYPKFYSDHYLLYEFIDPYVELYYNGKAKNPDKLFMDLYKSHLSDYSNDLPINYNTNVPKELVSLCEGEMGLFARGPKRIVDKYEECLRLNGVKTSIIGELSPKNKNSKLMILGESYFIGESFEFEKLKKENVGNTI